MFAPMALLQQFLMTMSNDMALKRSDPSYPGYTGGLNGDRDRIEIVDMECGAGIDYRDKLLVVICVGHLHLYPFDTGYEKMADVWFSGFQAIQPVADAGSDQNVNGLIQLRWTAPIHPITLVLLSPINGPRQV